MNGWSEWRELGDWSELGVWSELCEVNRITRVSLAQGIEWWHGAQRNFTLHVSYMT